MIVREFNEAGIKAFKQFLSDCRGNPALPVPTNLLEDAALTKVLNPAVTIEARHFKSRRDAADYLTAQLAALPDQLIADSAGLWTWLALFFFDEVCPPKAGKRTVRNDYYYIFEPKNPRHFYRHLLHIAWLGKHLAPVHNRLLLDVALTSLDQVTAEILKRLFLTRIPSIFEVLDRIYWDDERNQVRSGIVTSGTVRPGDLIHRFHIRIRQLECTYDLVSLTADHLIELLGDEFKFVTASKPKRKAALFS
jgi:hypothetical protein